MTTLLEQLIGSWELVSYSHTTEDGSVGYPLGEDATGYIMYTPDGYMSAQLMRAGRPQIVSGDALSGDAHAGNQAEMSAAAAGYLAYAGPFEADEQTMTLRHHMTVSLFPNWLGHSQERTCQIDGDKLTLSCTLPGPGGKPLALRIEWSRATPNL